MSAPAHLRSLRALLLTVALTALATSASAQRGGGPPPGMGGQPGGGLPRGPFGNPSMGKENPRNSPPPNTGGNPSTMRGGLQLGPPGRWWDDHSFAKTLGLDSNQQHRMDDVFNSSKPTLIKLFKALQHEESQLEKTTRKKDLDEAEIFQQIDRVTQARGELEKASAHYLLEIRKTMTPDQLNRLDDHRTPPTE